MCICVVIVATSYDDGNCGFWFIELARFSEEEIFVVAFALANFYHSSVTNSTLVFKSKA